MGDVNVFYKFFREIKRMLRKELFQQKNNVVRRTAGYKM